MKCIYCHYEIDEEDMETYYLSLLAGSLVPFGHEECVRVEEGISV